MLITSIIFSKDRPLQLDLCLKSIHKNLQSSTRNIVIYKCSNDKYQEAYDELQSTYENVEFWPQGKSLLRDIYHSILTESDNEFFCFFVDDCIVYRNTNIDKETITNMFNDDAICCISLRLGTNVNKRSHQGVFFSDEIGQHAFHSKEWVMCSKTSVRYGNYWSYSLSVDGHIFRKSDMYKMVNELIHISKLYDNDKEWKNTPNTFEAQLQRFWTVTPNIMICPVISAVVNSPNNKTQNSHPNQHGEVYSYDQDSLLELFLSGKRINIEKLEIKDVECPHKEIDILKGLS